MGRQATGDALGTGNDQNGVIARDAAQDAGKHGVIDGARQQLRAPAGVRMTTWFPAHSAVTSRSAHQRVRREVVYSAMEPPPEVGAPGASERIWPGAPASGTA